MAGVTIGPDGSMNWVGEPAVKKPRKRTRKQGGFEWYGDDIVENVKNALPIAIKKACVIVQGSAKGYSPVDTGALKGSITIEPINEYSAKVGPAMDPYDIFVEMGTRKMAAQPYMRPAADKNRERVARQLGVVIGQAIKAGAK